MEKSIYQLISENITDDGKLSENFLLPEENTSGVKWAPGAWDGVNVYHMGPKELSNEQMDALAEALRTAAAGNTEEADRLFAEWTTENRAINYVDEIQMYVIDHQNEMDIGNIFRTAMFMILDSTHIECVKIGMELLEIFTEPEESIKDVIRILGLCDEFTIFSVWNARKWKSGNEEVFRLAKGTEGWGRIHAVNNLKPESDEIRFWLLTEGTVNSVENAYSALTCWEKAKAETILFAQPAIEEYKGISVLINALLDEGPVPGISELGNAEDVLLRFLELSKTFPLDITDIEHIRGIREWAADKGYSNIVSACNEILHSPGCVEIIKGSINEGKGLQLAEELGIPFLPQLLACMQNDFEQHYYQCRYLMKEPEYRETVVDLFRSNLPLSEMEGELSSDAGLGKDFLRYTQLDFILQELRNVPLLGTDLIMTGLKSPVVRCRNRAMSVLKQWTEITGKPLSQLSQELSEAAEEYEKVQM